MKTTYKITGCVATLVLAGTTLLADQPATPPAATPAKPETAAPTPAATTAPGAPPATQVGATPKIQFATPTYDFGKMKSGEAVKHTFWFTNTGDATLELSNVQPSCGCTTAGEWTKKVEPGQVGSIPIQVATANFNGPIHKAVTVVCNDKVQPTVSLQIQGTVWKPVEVNPQFAMMNVTPDNPSATTVIRIINNGEEPMTLTGPEINNKSFTAEVKETQPGKQFEVTVRTVGGLTSGSAQGMITFKTSLKDMPTVNVTAWANVMPRFTVSPSQLSLPPGPLAGKTTMAVTIQNNSTNATTVNHPLVNAKDVNVEIQELQPGRTFRANLTFPEGFELPAGQTAELSLQPGIENAQPLKVQISQPPKAATPGAPTGVPVKSAAVPAPPLRAAGQ